MLTGRGLYSLCLFTLHSSPVPPFLSPAVDLPASVIAGWPPRSRTERYRFIRAAPSTGWVVASGRRRTRPPAVARSPEFESGTASMAVSSPRTSPRCERAGGCGGWRSRLPAPCGAHPLSKREPAPWPVHPPSEEGGRLERQGVTPAPVSNGARRACPVHLPFVPNRGFEPRTSWSWARRLYLSWASSACERLTGFEPATSTVARWCSCLLSYNRMEPSPGADPGGTPVPRASGRRSEGHRSGSWTRTSVRLLQGWDAVNPPGTNWSPRQVPPLVQPALQGDRPVVGPGGECPRRDSNAHCRRSQRRASCRWATRARAATRGRTGPSAVRRRSRKPCAAAKLPLMDSNHDSRLQRPLSCR